MTPREAYIAMNLVDGLGPVRVRALLDRLGSPEAVCEASPEELAQARGIGRPLAQAIAAQWASIDARHEQDKAERLGARIITFVDEEYPASLRTLHDPPLALYVLGTLKPCDRHALAVVGSRQCTHYGRSTADRLAYQLAKAGYTVVSGLARGIDTAGHQGALKAGGRTIAVLGSGLDELYPAENEPLARKIAAQGALISEYPLGRKPDRTTFPYRNRIVSGLVQGVLVVESSLQSGALITVDAALEQGRSVFAVPGRIDAPASRGCHRLIKNGAKLVEDLDDILEEFEWLLPEGLRTRARETLRRPDVPLSAEEAGMVKALGEGPLDVDELAGSAGLTAQRVGALLLGLEMKRVVRLLPGRRVELVVCREDIREAAPEEVPGGPPRAAGR